MKTVEDLNQYGLDSLELKALSVPSSLRFLLGIEYDVVLCVNEIGTRRPFRLHFPLFAPTFRKLLTLCAARFGLECEHDASESVLSGTASMPLLRYADYLPGALHVKEILECLQVEPATKAKKWTSTAAASSTSSSSPPAEDAAAAQTNNNMGNGGSAYANEFAASFIDYAEYASDRSLDDVHGLGFYLMLDYGLSLATHSHLVGIRFHKDWDAKEALREFQEFSGWGAFDLRFLDEQRRQDGGVIVMPSSQDACDLLEKYEDEDSDDEGDLLPFILRPVSPLVSVPSLEDSALRKLRDQHWAEVEKHWSHLPRTLNTVVVYNLYENATLSEIMTFFEPLPIVASEFVEDDAPSHRRRAFLTFANLDATRKALDVDGKNTRGCTLRVQVSPPYISASRRGREVKVERAGTAAAPMSGGATARAGSSPKLAANGNGGGKGTASASPSSSPSTRAAAAAAAAAVAAVAAVAAAAPSVGGAAERATEAAAKPPPQPRVAASAPSATTTTHVNVPSAVARPATGAAVTVSTTANAIANINGSSTAQNASSAAAAAAAAAATRPVNASAVIAGAIAARARLAAEAPKAASTSPFSAPIALPHVAPATAVDCETSVSVGSASSSHGGSHMNASAKEFVPHFQLSANSPEYHPSPAPTVGTLYGFNGLPAPANDAVGLHGPAPPPPPPPPPPAYSEVRSPQNDYRPTPRSAQLLHAGAPPNLPVYTLPPPYLPGEGEMDGGLPPPPLPPPY